MSTFIVAMQFTDAFLVELIRILTAILAGLGA